MFMVVRKSDKSKQSVSEKAAQFVSNDGLNTVSLDVIEVIDYSEKGKASFNRVYQIFDGVMQVIINDQEINLQKGDSIFIEKGMNFEIKGTFKAVAVHRVAF